MAHIIAICGSGGKTTLCKSLARYYASMNKKVCVLTTTHMWHDEIISDINKINRLIRGQVYYFGTIVDEKVTFVSDADYKFICKKFEYVIIEADGSKSLPMKIPNYDREPVIPKNVNEIIVVSGLQAIGRKIGVVCHRFSEFYGKDKFLKKMKIDKDTIVTRKILDGFVKHYYIDYLYKRYGKAKLSTCYVDMTKSHYYEKIQKVGIAICASGNSVRFGTENKLLVKIGKKELYKIMIEKLLCAKRIVLKRFKEELSYDKLDIDVALISRHDEILSNNEYNDALSMIRNDNADVGLSSSIKLAVKKFYNYDAIMFINADLPSLEPEEISRFLYYSICSNTGIASMYVDMPKNPAYFEKEYFDEILCIDGDKGPKELLNKYRMNIYKYMIDANSLIDIDTKDDLKKVVYI